MEREPMIEEIQVATRAHAESVVDALVLAFVRDPLTRFAFPEPTQHRAGFGELVLGMGGGAPDCGSAFTTRGFGGVALWLLPGSQSTRPWSAPASSATCPATGWRRSSR